MPQVRSPLAIGEFYHTFNRGVARQPVFLSNRDYEQAQLSLNYYRFVHPPMAYARFKEQSVENRQNILQKLEETEKHIEIISYVFMPNHFHFLLQQKTENGISKFISNFTNSYTRYFNIKHKRIGPLFQGNFKSVHIETDEQLLHLSRYIHINPVVSHVIKDTQLFTYPWSSLYEYLYQKKSLAWKEPILKHFRSIQQYQQFINDQIDYGKQLEKLKHLTLE